MKKSKQIIIGAVAVVVVGVAAYAMGGGEFLQGRITKFGRNSNVTYSKLPCLRPSEWDKKYNIPTTPGTTGTEPKTDTGTDGTPVVGTPGTPGAPGSSSGRSGGGGTSTEPKRTDGTDTTTTDTSGNNGDDTKKPIVINPGTIIGTGNTGGTVKKGADGTSTSTDGNYSSPAENENGPKTNWVECSCARQGYKYITKDAQGKDVQNICYVQDSNACIPPEFKCPEGTQTDYPALYDLCKTKKQKDCFSAKGPDNTSKDDAMCKALIPAYKDGWTCVLEDDCKEYAAWFKAGTLTPNMTKNGVSLADAMTCADMYTSIWYGK